MAVKDNADPWRQAVTLQSNEDICSSAVGL
jgi:hypothetical protein